MTRICWWLVTLVSRALEPDERDAVRGDFAESGETGGQALRDVLGLVVRRQAALWKGWRPWLALVGLIVPLAMLLSIVSSVTAGVSATYIWLYANNWDWALLKGAGFWYEFADSITFVFVRCLTLVCWSWTAGFVLGSVSRRIVGVNAVLFCLMLLFGGLLGAPRYLAYVLQFVHRPLTPDHNDPVFALAFYRMMFPLIVQAFLVAVPSLLGMRNGAEVGRLRPLLRTVLWTAAIATLSALVIQEPGFGLFLNAYRRPGIWQGWQIQLLHFVVYWPIGYLGASAIGRRWRGNTAPGELRSS
jgi:hypothetical protein